MSDHSQRPANAFSPLYLAALEEKEEPAGASEAETAGPWVLRERDGKLYVFREWESFETGHVPMAEFEAREDALAFLLALRVSARPALFRMREASEPSRKGYEVEREGETAGRIRVYRPDLLTVAHALAGVARSPADLALLMELSGPLVQQMTGEILAEETFGTRDAGIPAGD